MTRRSVSLLCLAGIILGGCAAVPTDPDALAQFKANNDPLEPMNRRLFAFNQGVDKVIIKPIATGYGNALSLGERDAIRHFLDNLNEPIIAANDILQDRLNDAGITLARFVVNTTVGIGGFRDVAKKNRLPRQSGDFGQTLSVWGFGEGPYLILPLFGPSSPRDGVGMAVDIYGLDPYHYLARRYNYPSWIGVTRTGLDGIDRRQRAIAPLDEMQHEAIDFYASFRSLYRQNRAAELRVGPAIKEAAPTDFYDDPGK
jgi:phospholipid-binding lipoprotein MlaA